MKTSRYLMTISRCTVALLAVSMMGLAAGCAWFLSPASAAADGGDLALGDRRQAAYLASRLLIAADHSAEAVIRLEEARKLADCPAPVYRALTEAYVRLGQKDKAQAAVLEGLEHYPDDVPLLTLRARFELDAGQTDKALESLDKAFKLSPRRQGVLELMSDARLQKVRQVRTQKDLDYQVGELIKIYERMLEARQGLERIPPLLVLSSLHMRGATPAKAVEYARQAVKIHPHDVRCLLALAQAQEAAGQSREALATYREVLMIDATNEDARTRIERLLDAQNNPDAKREFYGALAKDFPDDKQFQLLYSRTLLDEKRWIEAETQLSKIASRWPDETLSRLDLARVWVELGRSDEALAAMRDLAGEKPALATLAKLSLAETLMNHGDRERALKMIDEVQKAGPPDSENALMALATLLLETKETERAITVLEDFNKRQPGGYVATLLLVQAYANQKRYAEAENLISRLPESVKQNKAKEILSLQSDLYRRQKQWEKALAALRELMQRDRRNAQLRMEAGLVCQEMERYAEAEEFYRKAIELAPDDAETYNTLGYFFAETNQRLGDAQKLIEKALQLEPDAGHIYDSLGWVLYRKGDFQQAVEKLMRAVELMGDEPDPVVFDHLGDAYEKLGKLEEAREAWRKSLAIDGGEATKAKEKLARYP